MDKTLNKLSPELYIYFTFNNAEKKDKNCFSLMRAVRHLHNLDLLKSAPKRVET